MQIDKFYTFYDFNYRSGYPAFRPLIQYHLKKRMEYLVNLYPNRDKNAWVDCFVEIIKNSSCSYNKIEKRWAYLHLLAYIDLDRCYLIWRNFRNFPSYSVSSQEFYDLTNNILFCFDKFKQYVDRYDANHISGAHLKTYLLSILKNAIREKLALTSGWRILCDVDFNSSIKFDRALKKRSEALERYGVSEPYRSRYIFALKYFIPVYQKNRIFHAKRIEGSKWPEPELLDFAEVASYYNSFRFTKNAPLQASSGSAVAPETVKKWIHICLKALRYDPLIKEVPYNGDREQTSQCDSFWYIDRLIDESINSSDLCRQTDLILQQALQKTEESFGRIYTKIPQQFRRSIMPLCYPHSLALLNQEKLGNKIGVHQGTISRCINKYFEAPLLIKFKQFANHTFNLEAYLTVFLETRFTNPKFFNLLDETLIETIQVLDEEAQKILKLRYSQKMNATDIARVLNDRESRTPSEIDLILVRTKNKLQEQLSEQLDKWQAEYVKLWLKKYYREMIQTVLLNSFRELNSVMQEILQMRYCQKINESRTIGLYPDFKLAQITAKARKQLLYSVLYWVKSTLQISLAPENQQVMETIEDWLSENLIYIDL